MENHWNCKPEMLLFIILGNFIVYSNSVFILKSYIPTCDNFTNNNGGFTIARKDWRVFVGDVEIIFNLCSSVDDKICDHHRACIRGKNSLVDCLLDEYKVPGNNKSILRSNDSKCELSIKWDCLIPEDQPTGRIIDKNKYEVSLMSHSPDCERPCGTFIDGKLLDFTILKGKYRVTQKNRTYSIYLCGLNPDCNFEASGCDITNKDKIIPFSSGNEMVTYDGINNIIKLKKKTKYPTGKKEFDLVMKCDWLASVPVWHYREKQIQGVKYEFEMESSYGCVKLPPECEFMDRNYKFNLTDVYNKRGYWEVENVGGSRKLFLNICGDMRLPHAKENNSCSISHSQVCELDGTEYVNRGSIYQQPVVSREKISMSIITGAKCLNNSRTYTTTIDFYCSKDESNPVVVKDENCELLVSWRTPAACPKQDIGSCEDTHSEPFTCTHKELLEHYDSSYDLSGLHSPDGYIVKDSHDTNIEYHLNVCGPVIDTDAPCKRNAIFAKHLDEYDIRKRIISLGKKSEFSVKNEHLVMENTGGDSCDDDQFLDWKSTIIFECSDTESNLTLKSKSHCKVEFLWQSKHVCPKTVLSKNACSFETPFSNHILDLTGLDKTYLTTEISGVVYLFDLCGTHKFDCSNQKCIYVPVNKNWVKDGNKTHLEFILNQKCDGKDSFNKTKLELVCDKMKQNEHFVMKERDGCTLVFQLSTNRACFDEDLIIQMEDHTLHKDAPYEVQTVPAETHDNTAITRNCSVRNQNTGYQFNISQLNLNISSKKCPDIVFNVESQVVTLLYESQDSCLKKNGERTQIDLRVMLECKKEHLNNSTQNGECSQNITVQLPEACTLLSTNILDNNAISRGAIGGGTIAAIVVPVLICIASMFGVLFWKCEKIRCRRTAYNSLAVPYVKYLDL